MVLYALNLSGDVAWRCCPLGFELGGGFSRRVKNGSGVAVSSTEVTVGGRKVGLWGRRKPSGGRRRRRTDRLVWRRWWPSESEAAGVAGAKPWSWRSYVDRSCALVKRDPSRVNLLLLFVTITYMFSKKNSTLMFVGDKFSFAYGYANQLLWKRAYL